MDTDGKSDPAAEPGYYFTVEPVMGPCFWFSRAMAVRGAGGHPLHGPFSTLEEAEAEERMLKGGLSPERAELARQFILALRRTTGRRQLTEAEVRERLGLLSAQDFLTQWELEPSVRFPIPAPRPAPRRQVRCRKCADRAAGRSPRTRAHHHACVLRGACHYRRGQQHRARDYFVESRGDKGWGRTTTMLCRAVAAASEPKHVLIAGYCIDYTLRLTQRARQMAADCGLDGGFISAARIDQIHPILKTILGSRDPIFFDHYEPPPQTPVVRPPALPGWRTTMRRTLFAEEVPLVPCAVSVCVEGAWLALDDAKVRRFPGENHVEIEIDDGFGYVMNEAIMSDLPLRLDDVPMTNVRWLKRETSVSAAGLSQRLTLRCVPERAALKRAGSSS